MSHVVNAHKTYNFPRFLPARFSLLPDLDIIVDMEVSPEVRIIWSAFLHSVLSGSKGPFYKLHSNEMLDSLVLKACRLFPLGLPGNSWIPLYAPTTEYEEFFKRLFKRTPPTPVSERWYTTEAPAYYFYAMTIFDILPLFLDNTTMRHFHGDNFFQNDDRAGYAKAVAGRLFRLRNYLTTEDYIRDSVLAMVSSIPRWTFVRLLETPDCVGSPSMKGLLAAINGFEKDTIDILTCKNFLSEALIARESIDIKLRFAIYRGLQTAALYLAEKHRSNEDTFWASVLQGGDWIRDGMSIYTSVQFH